MAAYYRYNQLNDFSPVLNGSPNSATDTVNLNQENTSSSYPMENLNQGQASTMGIDGNCLETNRMPLYMPSQIYCDTMLIQPNYYCQSLDSSFQHNTPISFLQSDQPSPVCTTNKQRKNQRALKHKDSITLLTTNDVRASKCRKRQAPSPGISNVVDRVFIWDLDETAIVFQSLLTGAYARKYGKDIQSCVNLGLEMEEFIFYLCDNYFFLKDLEEYDQIHVDELLSEDSGQDLSNYDFQSDGLPSINNIRGSNFPPHSTFKGSSEWLKKIAFRYRRVKEMFLENQSSLQSLLSTSRYDRWLRLRCDLENYTDSWTTLSHQALNIIAQRRDCINIMVTSTQLIPALAKLLLFGLARSFDVNSIYSAAKVGKEICFERIANRFDRKTTFVVIGDGPEEECAAKQLNWPYWRVSSHSDLVALQHALDMEFL